MKAHKLDAQMRWHTMCLMHRMCSTRAHQAEAGLSCRRAVAQRAAAEAISADLLAVLVSVVMQEDSVPVDCDVRHGMIADLLAEVTSLLDKQVRSLSASQLKGQVAAWPIRQGW